MRPNGRDVRPQSVRRHILHEAEKEAESKKREAALEAQTSWYQAKASLEQEAAATKLELQRLEKKILVREENLERKFEHLEEKEHALQTPRLTVWSSARNSTLAKSRNSPPCWRRRRIP